MELQRHSFHLKPMLAPKFLQGKFHTDKNRKNQEIKKCFNRGDWEPKAISLTIWIEQVRSLSGSLHQCNTPVARVGNPQLITKKARKPGSRVAYMGGKAQRTPRAFKMHEQWAIRDNLSTFYFKVHFKINHECIITRVLKAVGKIASNL